ncbi:MAG: S1 RNA-binding domain-containing protein [Candidatus Lokiarchaeota archaeon]|nr:S1 RNA-binding domain-containing protein [Candidatus Lokiarchaeota archaeon]MBD3201146.1 S1 RNA-binding domain-containing protein [Candidatus Lokiarchaeota archaeon]
MVKSRYPFPREGDFVVTRVIDIKDQYVYVELLDYEGLASEEHARGMVHISEISSRWIKNIRNYVRIGQKIVLRVVRVDPSKGHVDLSLRRTNTAQRKNRMKEWKYALKYENLLQFLADEYDDMGLEEAYDKIGFPVLEFFNDSYQETIEELKENGDEILDNLTEVDDEIKKKFLSIIDENVEISTVTISGKLKLKFSQGNGIELIKEVLHKAGQTVENPKVTRNLEISYIAAPFYRIEVISKDYLDAENILSDMLDTIEEDVDRYDAVYDFIRK